MRWIFPSKTTAGVADPNDYEQYGYDVDGNRTSLRKRDGSVLVYRYDALNRMTAKTVPPSATGAPGYGVFYGYDNRGLQTFARFGSASGPGIANVYDGFGRLAFSATAMDGVSRSIASQYDADGNRILLTGDQSYYAPFGHDGLGRMSAYADLARFGYDVAERRSSLALGPARASSAVGYAYDPAGRLQTLTHDLGGTSGDQAIGFAYNPASQIVTRTGTNDTYAWTGSVAVNRPYSVNGQNQYTAAGPASFAYDANGNLTSDGSTNFVYDAENRLVSASGSKNASLAYDPLGRLWQVTSGANVTRFLYDGDRLVMEYDGSGALARSYVHGPGTDEPLVWYEGTAGWARRFLHSDHQGSIIALADDNGTPVAINAYDEYGIPNAGNQGRFQYTGQAWIPELGMFYYKARIYSPTLGRFLQVDPIGYEDQINLYAYVGNDPLNLRDPAGKRACGRRCWESNGEAKSRPDVIAAPEARQFAKQHSSDVHVSDLNEAVDTNEKLSGVNRQPNGTLKLERLTSTGSSDKGDYVKGGGQLNSNTELAMHGHPETVVPGPLDDSSISKGIPLGIEHDGRFGMLEFKDGRYRFSLDKGSLRAEPGPKGRSEKKELQKVLDEYQGRLK